MLKTSPFDAAIVEGKAISYTNCSGTSPVDTYSAGFIKAVPFAMPLAVITKGAVHDLRPRFHAPGRAQVAQPRRHASDVSTRPGGKHEASSVAHACACSHVRCFDAGPLCVPSNSSSLACPSRYTWTISDDSGATIVTLKGETATVRDDSLPPLAAGQASRSFIVTLAVQNNQGIQDTRQHHTNYCRARKAERGCL